MYHYTESGLQNIYLRNGYKTRQTDGGKAVAIHDVEELHRVIGRAIANRGHMTGAQFRFLRKELDLSQSRVGSLFGATEESVSLWERRGRVPKGATRMMQAMYLEAIDGSVKFKELVEALANLDREDHEKMYFEDTLSGWKEAA